MGSARPWIVLATACLWACDAEPAGEPDGGMPDGDLPYPESPFEATDVFVGTGGDGFGVGSSLPGATVPFGLVRLSPDTSIVDQVPDFSHCGGYAYGDRHVLAFSHTHMHGIGVPGYGHVRFMPTLGWSDDKIEQSGYRSAFSHETEEASPGFYAVTLEDGQIRVELSAGLRTGYHRWTWPADTAPGDAVVVVDLGRVLADGEVFAGSVEVLPGERRLRGHLDADPSHGGRFVVHFDALFDHELESFGVWHDGAVEEGLESAEGTHVGAWLAFDAAAPDRVEAAVGISLIDEMTAASNRSIERAGGLDEARERARQDWEEALGVVEVEGGSAREQRILYSALYHVFQHPTLFTEAGARYLGFDGAVHTDDRPYYSDFSLWDTYRTLHPLLILLRPDESADMAQSLVRMYEQWGGLPRWPLATSDSGSMIGTSADVVLAETWLKGVRDFDVETAWEAMRAHADGPVDHGGRDGIEDYLSLGYVAADHEGASVSRTEEFAWDDFALSGLAEALGDAEAARLYDERSRTIAALWHDESGFFRGRNADGSWVAEFEDRPWMGYYEEGNAWQHLWLTPHADLLAELMGGNEGLVARLEDFFERSRQHWEEENEYGRLLPLPYYWHGNEPDLHAAYLFAAAGAPAEAQRWVRWIMAAHYGLGPDGLAGNDDAGTLSAWYVFSALGFYPLAGSDLYYVGTPAFDRATVHLPGGDLVIEAVHRDRGAYVQSVELDGAPLDEPWLRHADLVDGARLRFEMGPEPSSWGASG